MGTTKKRAIVTLLLAVLLLWGARGETNESCLIDQLGNGSKINTFVGPVISPGHTLSGQFIYFASFKVLPGRFWEGDLVKFKISDLGEILDKNGSQAIGPDDTIKADATPFWSIKDWADPSKPNFILHSHRKIYTYLGSADQLTDPSNQFTTSNSAITEEMLGLSLDSSLNRDQVIQYVRGADVFDEDGDGDTTENRAVITGDILHSEPEVVKYRFPDGRSLIMLFYGANDGMLHALLDSEIDAEGNTISYGIEKWAFIPPDQLHKLGPWISADHHQVFVDSSPEVLFLDNDADGILEITDGDRMVLVCGQRGGGRSYFALDVTDPVSPRFLWRISNIDDHGSFHLSPEAAPDLIVPELGETWSEPRFARVKIGEEDQQGRWVVIVGGGYSWDNSAGRALLVIDAVEGTEVRLFKNGLSGISEMDYSIPSAVALVDGDNDGFLDKIYVGDTGGNVWRFGKVTDSDGNPLPFPEADENIMTWEANILFQAGEERKFFVPPSVTLEKTYDLIIIGTGDRADPCNSQSSDRIYAFKDNHTNATLGEQDLVNVTTSGLVPLLDNPSSDVDGNERPDMGWYIMLAQGEKVLQKTLIFNRVLYFSTFTPGDDGGTGRIYALNYKTGEAVLFESGTHLVRNKVAGRSLPSVPIMYIGEKTQKLFVATKVANPSNLSESLGAGILAIKPLMPPSNLFYLWWMHLL